MPPVKRIWGAVFRAGSIIHQPLAMLLHQQWHIEHMPSRRRPRAGPTNLAQRSLWSKSGHMDCQKQKEQTNKQIIVGTRSLLIQTCTKICIAATRPFHPMYSTLTKKNQDVL